MGEVTVPGGTGFQSRLYVARARCAQDRAVVAPLWDHDLAPFPGDRRASATEQRIVEDRNDAALVCAWLRLGSLDVPGVPDGPQ
jgi:hypothetical protein